MAGNSAGIFPRVQQQDVATAWGKVDLNHAILGNNVVGNDPIQESINRRNIKTAVAEGIRQRFSDRVAGHN